MTITLDRVTRVNGLDNGHHSLVLRDVSLSFAAGRTTGILGTRGAGKTTLVKLLTGALRPSEGRIIRHGRVSFPIGSFGWMNRFMTGRENLHFLASLYGIDPSPIVAFVTEFAGLGNALDQHVGAYSGEKRARLAFATSYAMPFDVYVADEFVIGGPPGFRDMCKAWLRERQSHSTVILVTRSPALVRLFCQDAGVMHAGDIRMHDHVQDAVLDHAELLATANAQDEAQFDTEDTAAWTEGAYTDAA